MSKTIIIEKYNEAYKKKWDKFVINDSMNGTFLQTRNFLDYHPKERFRDNSLLFLSGSNILAVIPAHIKEDNIFYSHMGSTYGGLVIGKKFCRIGYLDIIFEELEKYLEMNNIKEAVFKQTGNIYQNKSSDLLEYYFFLNGYTNSAEIGYYIDYKIYDDDIISNFTSSRRRDYRYSLKNNFTFKELVTDKEISLFYNVLCDNYSKFNKTPVHTLNELLDFKNNRLSDCIKFYGVYSDDELIAGGMIFLFGRKVFHTQYLAVKQDKVNMFANEFLYKNLIETAKKDGFDMLSFGTSTLDGGKVLNRPLAQFKEGFGTSEYVNRTFRKMVKE